jgi:hypothetical protein
MSPRTDSATQRWFQRTTGAGVGKLKRFLASVEPNRSMEAGTGRHEAIERIRS